MAERLADDNPAAVPAGTDGWSVVERLESDAPPKHSGDIEVKCWLTESLTRRRGLAGLADGAAILAGLVGRFRDRGLFPALDEEEGPRAASPRWAG